MLARFLQGVTPQDNLPHEHDSGHLLVSILIGCSDANQTVHHTDRSGTPSVVEAVDWGRHDERAVENRAVESRAAVAGVAWRRRDGGCRSPRGRPRWTPPPRSWATRRSTPKSRGRWRLTGPENVSNC